MVRFKNRYLLVDLNFSEGHQIGVLHPKGLEEAIKDSVLKLSGDYGLACVQRFLTVKYLNAVTQVAIVRSPREHYRGVWAAISLMRSVGSRPFSPRVLHVGGTIRSCQKSLVAVDRERLKVALQSTKSTAHRKRLVEKYSAIIKQSSL